MRETPRWMKAVLEEAEAEAIRMPFERGHRRAIAERRAETADAPQQDRAQA